MIDWDWLFLVKAFGFALIVVSMGCAIIGAIAFICLIMEKFK